ncbi:MAG TPA: hypothetical protein VFN11_14360 [Ktedonobacterales bacterium]|nr:hypothetical protein [Ktedonobacterales bacterium]
MAEYEPISAEDHAKLQAMLTEFYDAIGRKNRALAAGIAYDIVGQQVIEALLAEVAAMREIVQWAAQQQPIIEEGTYEKAHCPGCFASFGVLGDYDWKEEVADLQHAPDCPVMKARALIEQEGS